MDRPARLVLIQVLIASVTLTNDTDVGIEWLFKGRAGDFGQVGRQDLALGGTGFTYMLNNSGQVRFALNALAQDQRVSILSEPRILVKSGETAQIDVGEEVPVITSLAQSTDAANAPVLQSIQYRENGGAVAGGADRAFREQGGPEPEPGRQRSPGSRIRCQQSVDIQPFGADLAHG